MGNFHYILYINKNNDGKYEIRTELEDIGFKCRAPGARKIDFDTLNEAFMSVSGTIEGNDNIKYTTIMINHPINDVKYECAIYKKGILWKGWVDGDLIVATPFRWLTLLMIKHHVKILKKSVSFTL